jgi:hypothetical protein
VLAVVVVAGHLWMLGGDLSGFVRAAPPFVQPDRVDSSLRPVDESHVYDGQYFYRLAVDPWVTRDVGVSLDIPSYRQQRILYPLIVHALALEQQGWIPFLLVAVNVVGLAVLGGLGATLAIELGAPAWWGCALPLWVGFTFSLARDLSEIVQACFLVGALLAVQRRRAWLAAALMALAVLARETAVILAVAMLATSIEQRMTGGRKGIDPVLLAGASGLVCYIGLQAALWARWGTPPLLAGSSNLAPPLSGPLFYWGMVGQLGRIEFAVFGLATPRVPGYVRGALVGYLVLLASLSTMVWQGDVAWLRAATEAAMLAWVSLFHASQRRVLLALTASTALWPAVARWAIAT